jgi:hypothetical protein
VQVFTDRDLSIISTARLRKQPLEISSAVSGSGRLLATDDASFAGYRWSHATPMGSLPQAVASRGPQPEGGAAGTALWNSKLGQSPRRSRPRPRSSAARPRGLRTERPPRARTARRCPCRSRTGPPSESLGTPAGRCGSAAVRCPRGGTASASPPRSTTCSTRGARTRRARIRPMTCASDARPRRPGRTSTGPASGCSTAGARSCWRATAGCRPPATVVCSSRRTTTRNGCTSTTTTRATTT